MNKAQPRRGRNISQGGWAEGSVWSFHMVCVPWHWGARAEKAGSGQLPSSFLALVCLGSPVHSLTQMRCFCVPSPALLWSVQCFQARALIYDTWPLACHCG